ncbi:hypothetical protein [Pseudomonas sp. S2_H01]
MMDKGHVGAIRHEGFSDSRIVSQDVFEDQSELGVGCVTLGGQLYNETPVAVLSNRGLAIGCARFISGPAIHLNDVNVRMLHRHSKNHYCFGGPLAF